MTERLQDVNINEGESGVSPVEPHKLYKPEAPKFFLRLVRLEAAFPWLAGMTVALLLGGNFLIGREGLNHSGIQTAYFAFSLFVLGGYLSIHSLQSRMEQALRAMKSMNASDKMKAAPLPSIGVPALDSLLHFHSKKMVGLLEIINTVQTNSENLLERYRILTENLAASVIIRDIDSHIIYASPYTEVLTGYSLGEIYGKEGDFFLEIVQEQDRERYDRAMRIALMGEGFNILYRAMHKSGMEMWFETRSEPVLDEDGEIISVLSITLDVTRTIRYQKQVEDKNRDLQDFAYMVSHDLKAPIFTIKGMVHVLKEDMAAKLNGDNQECFAHIDKATQTLEKLVASVLEYSRISAEGTALCVVDLNAVFQDIKNDYASQIAAAGVVLEVPEGLPAVYSDRIKTYQIFGNLVGNAIKFRDPARPCTIQISAREEPGRRQISVAVRDNGLGIPSDKLESIFRPFHRAHGAKIEGSGIGLASVKRLLEKVEGTVQVESKEGEGSAFTVSLKAPQN